MPNINEFEHDDVLYDGFGNVWTREEIEEAEERAKEYDFFMNGNK